MKRPSHAMGYYILLSAIYLLLAVALPGNTQASRIYHLTIPQYHLLQFMVILPLMLLAFSAFYGYAKLQNYANSIEQTPEGKDFDLLALGCKWLAWGLLIPAIITIILSSIANAHPGFAGTSLIISNYVSLLVAIVAFGFISTGSHGLLSRTKKRLSALNLKMLIIAFVLIGVIYCFLTFRQLVGNSIGSTNNPYALPLWLMFLTIIIPYLYAWIVGLLAAYEIILFSKLSRGVLYRHALQQVASGLSIVIASSVALQYLSAAVPRNEHLSLNSSLAATYAIRLGAAVGYILIARGAMRMKKIEEV
ncbi:MAG: hypothetical protein ABI602_02550 [Candidatus Saccharibacteria bacterium]